MIEDTILVVEADHETEEKIVSTLETEGYLVFTASGHDVIAGMAGKISPALIYLKPAANSVEGFEVCKTIHNMEKYKNVPIILLASLKGPLDTRYTAFYGIVDYLKMPLSSEELIEKTEKILGVHSDDLMDSGAKDIGPMEEESAVKEEKPATSIFKEPDEEETEVEEDIEGPAEFDKKFAGITEIGQPNENYSYRDSKKGGMFNRGRRRPNKSSLLIPLAVVLAVIAIAAAGSLSYKFFISKPEVKAPVAIVPPKAVQKQQELPVLPPPEQQKPEQPRQEQQKPEQPVAEAKPVETKAVPREAPAAVPEGKASKKPPVTKDVPKEAAAVVPETKAAGKPFYSVQLGAFKSESGADALVKTYKGKGYEAFSYTGKTKDKGTLYRALIGKFENRKEAVKLAAQVETKEKIKTIIFSEK